MSYKVGMVSLGCSKNQVDGEMLLATVQQAGYTLCNSEEEADAVIVNTCGFIESAKKESIDEILQLARRKEAGKLKAIVVTGCLAERYQTEIRKELPEVDAVLGIGANKDIALALKEALEGHKKELFASKYDLSLSGERVLSTPKFYAYLKISDGCDTVNDATAFLETFFKLYQTDTEKELAYYVSGNVIEPISRDYLYSELVNPIFTNDGDNVKVKVAVKFLDNQTKATQVSQYELVLHKDSNWKIVG